MALTPSVETLKEHYQQTQANQVKTKRPGILTVATSADFYPYKYINDQGDLVGIGIEIVETIATQSGFNSTRIWR